MQKKICSNCKVEKELSEFGKNSRSATKLQYACKDCRREQRYNARKRNPEKYKSYSSKYRQANLEKYAEWRYKTRHGITKSEMLEILNQQNGCKLCGAQEPNGRFWVIDHDHSCCGKINSCNKCRRGVICEHCNKLLAFANDNPDVLARAVEYLERYERSK